MERREVCQLRLYRDGIEAQPPITWTPTPVLAVRSQRFDELEPGTTYEVVVESREDQRSLSVTTENDD